ncbi:DMT family transporter [Streptomyces sp. NPDC056069]|uniref:DMT family transporter n=1 Tax=Streptomyces sp. NPDC056069 TaxID=3345702 RepID=UPI0035D8CE5C
MSTEAKATTSGTGAVGTAGGAATAGAAGRAGAAETLAAPATPAEPAPSAPSTGSAASAASAEEARKKQNVGWTWLLFSSLFEITFALSTEATHAFTRLGPSLLTAVAAAFGIYGLSQALKYVDVGVGYTVWAGIGGVGTVIFGTLIYDEPMTVWKVVAFVLIIGGGTALRVTDRIAAAKSAT